MATRLELELKCPACGARGITVWMKDVRSFRPVDLFPGFFERMTTPDRKETELACFLCETTVAWPAG